MQHRSQVKPANWHRQHFCFSLWQVQQNLGDATGSTKEKGSKSGQQHPMTIRVNLSLTANAKGIRKGWVMRVCARACVHLCDAQTIQSKLRLRGSTFLRPLQDISETMSPLIARLRWRATHEHIDSQLRGAMGGFGVHHPCRVSWAVLFKTEAISRACVCAQSAPRLYCLLSDWSASGSIAV